MPEAISINNAEWFCGPSKSPLINLMRDILIDPNISNCRYVLLWPFNDGKIYVNKFLLYWKLSVLD